MIVEVNISSFSPFCLLPSPLVSCISLSVRAVQSEKFEIETQGNDLSQLKNFVLQILAEMLHADCSGQFGVGICAGCSPLLQTKF